MPYTAPIGPRQDSDPFGLESMIDSALWAGAGSASPAEQAQAYAELQATNFNDPGPASTFGSVSQWLQRNTTAVYLGIGALVLMSVFKGRR